MGSQFTTFFTRLALDDMRDIYGYIVNELQNSSSAAKLIDQIEEKVKALEEYPYIGSAVLESELQERGYRKLIINNYVALYTVDEHKNRVNIIRVIYGKRNYGDLF